MTKLKKIELKDGFVVVPDNFIIVESSITSDANYAGVVVERSDLTYPFVFLSNKEIPDMSLDDELRVVNECCKLSYALTSIYFESEHHDAEEMLSFFQIIEIPVMPDINNLYFDTGIIRSHDMDQRIMLQNGTVIVPKDYIFIEETASRRANYAGVVAEKNGSIPYFFFLSEKPIAEMKEADEEKIYELCSQLDARVGKIHKQEVEAEFDENGRLKNAKKWLDSPRLGIFAVPEVNDENDLHHGVGLIREATL